MQQDHDSSVSTPTMSQAALAQLEREVSFDDEWDQFDELGGGGNDSEGALGGGILAGGRHFPASTPHQHQLQPSRSSNDLFLVDVLPPQLHPAVSAGMQRVTSCYFSLGGSCSEASNSVADLYSLLGDESEYGETTSESAVVHADSRTPDSSSSNKRDLSTADLLYHDIIMTVFTFLDAKSLAAFSETARRPNFECFYFLQLQLQRALLEDNLLHLSWQANKHDSNGHHLVNSVNDDPLSAIAGSACISRLASFDKQEAKDTVQEYLDSNSTLRTMPLSHSLAYIRQLLRKHAPADTSSPAALTSAAFVITLIGAATVMTGNVEAAADSFGTELPNVLFKVGFVGSIMGAAKRIREHGTEASPTSTAPQELDNGTPADVTQQTAEITITSGTTIKAHTRDLRSQHNATSMRETAEHVARAMQGLPSQFLQHMVQARTAVELPMGKEQSTNHDELSNNTSIPQRMYEALVAASQHLPKPSPPPGLDNEDDDDDQNDDAVKEEQPFLEARDEAAESELDTDSLSRSPRSIAIHQQFTPNPYEHVPAGDNPAVDKENLSAVVETADTTSKGGVGLRRRGKTDKDTIAESDPSPSTAVSSDNVEPRKMASGCVGAYFRAIRRATGSITQIIKARRVAKFEALPDKQQVAQAFIDACCSDESLPIVIDLVQKRGTVDVEGFFVGQDGTETCALHASAFHGATEVLKFLCGGIHERDASQDQGLCSVNLKDSNGWTAVHFAAGANSVEAVRILAEHGADLAVEATNGYTPLQWAQRLCNEEVAAELKKRLEPDHHLTGWISASQPLSMIAHRFFAMIPTH